MTTWNLQRYCLSFIGLNNAFDSGPQCLGKPSCVGFRVWLVVTSHMHRCARTKSWPSTMVSLHHRNTVADLLNSEHRKSSNIQKEKQNKKARPKVQSRPFSPLLSTYYAGPLRDAISGNRMITATSKWSNHKGLPLQPEARL